MPAPAEQTQKINELEATVASLEVQILKIRRKLMWMTIYGIFKVIVIVLPLIIGLWYFGPQIKSVYGTWAQLSADVSSFQRGEYINPNEGMQQLLQQYLKE